MTAYDPKQNLADWQPVVTVEEGYNKEPGSKMAKAIKSSVITGES